MYHKNIVYLVLTLFILLVGFISGYFYGIKTTSISTSTVTSTMYKTITLPSQSIVEVTRYIYIESTPLITYTETFVQTVLRTTTITTVVPSIQYVLMYPFNPWAFVDFNDDGVDDIVVEINPWNTRSFEGVQKIVIDLAKRIIKTEFNLSNVQPREWANGYPEVYIGRKPWSTKYVNGFNVNFPMKISNATPFIVSFYICILNLLPSMNFNIAADAWIVREDIAKNPGTPPSNGDLEIMVWLFNQNLNPAGKKTGETVIPIVVNGSIVEITFEVWRHDSVEWGGWQYIAFKPKNWRHRCGYIAYNTLDFVKTAASFATLDISEHYLLGWEIGTEWGTISSNGVAVFSWILKDFIALPMVSIKGN
ncbi:MAG: endoglucanase [Ignisphaera sp.]